MSNWKKCPSCECMNKNRTDCVDCGRALGTVEDFDAVAPLLTQLQRERQERIEAGKVASSPTPICRECGEEIIASGSGWQHKHEDDGHAAVPARTMMRQDAHADPSPLATCAAFHEREAARFHEFYLVAVDECHDAQAQHFAEERTRHGVWAAACREADNN